MKLIQTILAIVSLWVFRGSYLYHLRNASLQCYFDTIHSIPSLTLHKTQELISFSSSQEIKWELTATSVL